MKEEMVPVAVAFKVLTGVIEETGVRHYELGEFLGLSPSTISGILDGQRTHITATTHELIMGMDVDELYRAYLEPDHAIVECLVRGEPVEIPKGRKKMYIRLLHELGMGNNAISKAVRASGGDVRKALI